MMALSEGADALDQERETVWDVVVVGSGYGAGVCAARLAEAGAKVCVLERGAEFARAPGDGLPRFPDDLDAIKGQVQVNSRALPNNNRLGLYDLHLDPDLDVLVGCGLGGTSLINANISIEPDARVFELDAWPSEIRDAGLDGLAPYFQRARDVLRPVRRPGALPPKVAAMARAATGVKGARFAKLEVNVHFGKRATNPVGVEQEGCNDCGDCVTGCNVGAKNTLCFTYLPLAKHFGARIFTRCSVDRVRRERDGLYTVSYQRVTKSDAPRGYDFELKARSVVLGAGVLGTTGILLRSRDAGLAVSPLLGYRFSGNGDALAFSYACDNRLDTVGLGPGAGAADARNSGATILGVIDARKGRPLSEGIILEDGAFPSGLAKFLRPLIQGIASYRGDETQEGFRNWLSDRAAEVRDLFASEHGDGVLNATLMSLIMGHDGADGRLTLDRNGNARIVWPQLKRRALWTREGTAAREMATMLGGMYVPDPLFTPLLHNNLITVHPLGGCAMGDDATHGVVDHGGRVFRDDGDVHAGLYVADGSVVPTSLGVNPLLTITALSERIVDHVTADLIGRGLKLTPRASARITPQAPGA